MTRKELKDNWHILEAYKNGEEIEGKMKSTPDANYFALTHLSFVFDICDYRIKPKTYDLGKLTQTEIESLQYILGGFMTNKPEINKFICEFSQKIKNVLDC